MVRVLSAAVGRWTVCCGNRVSAAVGRWSVCCGNRVSVAVGRKVCELTMQQPVVGIAAYRKIDGLCAVGRWTVSV